MIPLGVVLVDNVQLESLDYPICYRFLLTDAIDERTTWVMSILVSYAIVRSQVDTC